MKILKDTLEPLVETWSDDGDYPNALAAGPLPSYDYLAGVEGEVILELDSEESQEFREDPKEFLANADIDLPGGILSVTWQVDKIDIVLKLNNEETKEFIANPEPLGLVFALIMGPDRLANEMRVTLSVKDCEPDPDYHVHDDGPEYDPLEWQERHEQTLDDFMSDF